MESSTTNLDLVDRFSVGSSKLDAFHAAAKTPDALDKEVNDGNLENGALRTGGAPNLWSRQYFGLLAQYAGVGLIYGGLPACVNPFLQNYLNMANTQVASAKVLLTMPWSFKVVYGIISDCMPIFGYRRRPYMVAGWTICAMMLFLMASMKLEEPYYINYQLQHTSEKHLTDYQRQHEINRHAPASGGKFIVYMMFAAVGYVMADVSADAVVVELAQRETLETRGTTQTTIYFMRYVFSTIAMMLVGFGLNEHHYGGSFDAALSFPTLMLIFGFLTIPIIPCSWLFIHEERVHYGISYRRVADYLKGLWQLLQNRAVYQVIAYRFISMVLDGVGFTAVNYIAYKWAGVTSLMENVVGMMGQLFMAVSLWYTKEHGLGWNWRHLMAYTEIAVIVIDLLPTMLTIWDLVRSPYFYLGGPLLEQIPNGIHFIIGSFVVVELAEVGNEAAVYGLVTTVGNLASPFAATIYKNIDAQFDVTNDDILQDTHHVRWHVTITVLISYACKLGSLLFLFMLPPQKAQVQELKRTGGSSKVMGAITFAYILFALCWSVTTNLLSIFASTACLRIAGGKGC